MKPPQTHVLKTPHRTATVVVTEHPQCVDVVCHVTAVGIFGDEKEQSAFLGRALLPYENDRRPIVIRCARTGDVAIVDDHGSSELAPLRPLK